MTRTVEPWAGKTDDAMPPPRVRLRIFQAHGGRCYRSGRLIRAGDKWALDHIIAIINGGANVEANLAPILEDAHKDKTAEDMAIKSKTYRIAAKHNGTWPKSKRPLKSRGFETSRQAAPQPDRFREGTKPEGRTRPNPKTSGTPHDQ